MQNNRRILLKNSLWLTPILTSSALPLHAQASAIKLSYFGDFHNGNSDGPRQMSVVVDTQAGTALVEALNAAGNSAIAITLDIDGAASNAFAFAQDLSCNSRAVLPMSSSWSVVGYTLGNSTIAIQSSGGRGSWTVEVPLGSGSIDQVC